MPTARSIACFLALSQNRWRSRHSLSRSGLPLASRSSRAVDWRMPAFTSGATSLQCIRHIHSDRPGSAARECGQNGTTHGVRASGIRLLLAFWLLFARQRYLIGCGLVREAIVARAHHRPCRDELRSLRRRHHHHAGRVGAAEALAEVDLALAVSGRDGEAAVSAGEGDAHISTKPFWARKEPFSIWSRRRSHSRVPRP